MSARRNVTGALVAALLLTAACQIHSPGQLELARTLLSRYTVSFADSLAITENLPAEEERLLAVYRSNARLISDTEELELLNTTWTRFHARVDELVKEINRQRKARDDEKLAVEEAVKILTGVRAPLAEALTGLNKGLKAADTAPTLSDQLSFVTNSVNGAITNIGQLQGAIKAASEANGDNMARLRQAAVRLQPLTPNLEKYFQAVVTGPTQAKGQNASLAVEATRLARDILAVEVDIIDQEIVYQETISDLADETLQALPDKTRTTQLMDDADAFKPTSESNESIAANLKTLALAGDTSESDMRDILELTGTWYYVQIQATRADRIRELKSTILAYRQAKLLDLAYDRQRRTLISYGLLAAVRYAEGGWKSSDTASLISIIQAGLQAGLLAKF